MGNYINPGNSGFKRIINGDYVDKTGLIEIINARVDSPDGLVCVSRPRRFGKSYAADMLAAYYDCSCDSSPLFDHYNISASKDYGKYINCYNVIILDMAAIISEMKNQNILLEKLPLYISKKLLDELKEIWPSCREIDNLNSYLIEVVQNDNREFVFIIDEWDAVIREVNDTAAQEQYLNFLRSWFKNRNFTPKVVAAAYMTGILPIKKDGSQSAVSDFKEFTILNPGSFTEYTGFTEEEVRKLCNENNMDFNLMKKWYDGYYYEGVGSIYNPYSVMETVKSGAYESHWQKTSVAENLTTYINMDIDGLQTEVLKLMADEPVKVNTRGFMNDFETFNSKEDVMTLLIHLGYLAYDRSTGIVRIPNEEIRLEFHDILENSKYTRLAELVRTSEKLLSDTLAGNEEAVANAIERVRETNYAPQYYNDEQALRYVIKFAYIICVDRFLRIEELPSGRGLADVVFIPKKDTAYPAIIIELKWNKDKEEAVSQIDEKKYASVLDGYAGEVVKVGLSYDEKSKIHGCRIEKTMSK